ncbi:MAG: hypothetical protein RIF46_10875 [Cyclobacteriaceae bacterium]
MSTRPYALNNLDDTSRIWIYQANRKLSKTEILLVRDETIKFLEQWNAHGNELKAGFSVLKDYFLIIGVDESFAQASGCSIDSSVGLVRKLNEYLGIDFLNRQLTSIQNSEDQVVQYSLKEIPDQIESGHILPGTLMFNTMIQTVGELKDNWLIPAKDSWMKRYFK